MNLDESLVLWLSERWASPLLDPFFVWLSDRWTFSFPLAGWLLLDSARREGKRGLALAVFLVLAVRLQSDASKPAALRLYLSSLAYLALLFAAMAVDRLIAI